MAFIKKYILSTSDDMYQNSTLEVKYMECTYEYIATMIHGMYPNVLDM